MSLYIGLMSGTSLDGMDAVLCRFDPHFEFLASASEGYPAELRQALLELQHDERVRLQDYAGLDAQLGELNTTLVMRLLRQSGHSAQQISAIGYHGQTIFHQPAGEDANSLQIGDANRLAERTGICTISDFRRRDMAAGGQGAPLVPPFHASLFRHDSISRCIVNLGGIANITQLPSRKQQQPVLGFDTGPANILMDGWAQRHLGKDHDDRGHWAASGVVLPELLQTMLNEAYFSQPPPKSTGRELFNEHWLEHHLSGGEDPADVQATLLELTARTVSDAIQAQKPACEEVYICGGGAANDHLMHRLQALLSGMLVTSTQPLGLPPQWVEAAAFAWLAQQTLHKKPGNLPEVTGSCGLRILGAIHPA